MEGQPMPPIKGRLLSRSIAESEGFASLSPRAAVLFLLIIPHLNSHGKMLANPYTLKGMVCPKIGYLTVDEIGQCMAEISRKTDLKYFCFKGSWFVHALNFDQYQKIDKRRGRDMLPGYSRDGAESPALQSQPSPLAGKAGAL
jgi:hypothetical protein